MRVNMTDDQLHEYWLMKMDDKDWAAFSLQQWVRESSKGGDIVTGDPIIDRELKKHKEEWLAKQRSKNGAT